MDRFNELGRRRGIKILEDAACAIGSRYKGRPIGGHSEMACFSFHPRKVITTGEGGMITTDNSAHADQLRLLRQHGMTVSDTIRHRARDVVIEAYDCVGYNYRMTDLQAAVGIEQIKRLDWVVGRRREIAARYDAALMRHPWFHPLGEEQHVTWNYQSYPVLLSSDAPLTRNDLMQRLLDSGVASRRGIMLSHLEAPYMSREHAERLPASEDVSGRCVLLPLFPQMMEAEVDQVVQCLFTSASSATATFSGAITNA
jgi:dTDP-4-amino-4,6-dideoxygalactose transaminase